MRMQNRKKSVLLISMPFAETSIPSIQLSLLESVLKKQNIFANSKHVYLNAADFYGLNNYNFLINDPNDSYTAQLVFSKYIFPNHWRRNKEKFRYYYENIISYDPNFSEHFSYDNYIKKTDEFINWITQEIDWKTYDIIGFSLNYGQMLPSLTAAKIIKENYPEKYIVFGGSSMINELGKRFLSLFPFVDFIVSGEGEKALSLLATDFENYKEIPGLIFRGKNNVIWNKNDDYINLNDLPFPSFESYFNDLANVSQDINQYYNLYGRLPIELSRGCWWNKCTFCNVYAYHKNYRGKKFDRFVKELRYLSDRYNQLDFQVIGSTLPQYDYNTLCNKIIDLNRDFNLVIESRAGLMKSNDYRLLRKAGFTHIQTGIESFSPHYLKKMGKGTRVIDNLAVLKYCRENRIKNSYNLIIGYPNEERVDFEETKTIVTQIQTFLEPPNISKFLLGYQSLIYDNLSQFNIEQIEPKLIDTMMYPKDVLDKNFSFFYSFKRFEEFEENPWKKLVSNWKKIYRNQKIHAVERGTLLDSLVFYFKDGGTFLKIYDKRYNDQAIIYNLNQMERNLFLACDDVISLSDLHNNFDQLNTSEVKDTLNSFVDAGIMYTENDFYLSLPLNYNKFFDKELKTYNDDSKEMRTYLTH